MTIKERIQSEIDRLEKEQQETNDFLKKASISRQLAALRRALRVQ